MFVALTIVFGLAALAPALHRVLRGATGWVLGGVAAGLTGLFASWLPAVADGQILHTTAAWAPSLGLEFAFRVDGWSLLFLLLIAGIGALILIYAAGYIRGHHQEGRFYALLLLFMGSMLGLVAADNLILLFVFWEMTSVSSFLLIGFDHEKKESRAAALQALLITGGGGLALLAGFILLGQTAGTYSISALLESDPGLRDHALYLPILLLVLAGAFTKSAQFPFHFWLPGAMAAPTPISAYLHSATMVKAGIFLLGRMNPILGDTVPWNYIVTLIGALTMVVGAALALPQTDLKRLLAYSTVSALGTLTLLLGLSTPVATQAAVVFLLVHSLYKGALFMVAGALDHEAGTRDVRALGGLARAMPLTTAAAVLAALSMSGFPPLLGFISKELLYEAQLQAPTAAIWVVTAGVLANILMVAAALIVGFRPFFGARAKFAKPLREAPVSLWLGPLLLALLGIVMGIFPSLVDRPLIASAATAIRETETTGKLALWHGFNFVLFLSFATVGAGVAVYLLRRRLRAWAEKLAPLARFGPQAAYDLSLRTMLAVAAGQTRLLQHGYLRGYVLTVFAVAAALAAFAMLHFGFVPRWSPFTQVYGHEIAVSALILSAALVAARTHSRLVAVAALGVVGYGVATVYALFGAPDLAMTQILIETLTLVLFVLVVVHLPRFADLSSRRRRLVDAAFATAGGVVITTLVLKALQTQPREQVSNFYVENAQHAHGRNITNVILVDFRALDTLGELAVLTTAALGVIALLRIRPESNSEDR